MAINKDLSKDKSPLGPVVAIDNGTESSSVTQPSMLKSRTDTRLKPASHSTARSSNRGFQQELAEKHAEERHNAEMAAPDPDNEKARQKHWFYKLIGRMIEDITGTAGDSPRHPLSCRELREKDELSQDDVAMADTDDAEVADMQVVHIVPHSDAQSGKTGRIFTMRGFKRFMQDKPDLEGFKVEGTTVGGLQHRTFNARSRDAENHGYVQPNGVIAKPGEIMLHPDLVKRMAKDPEVARLVALTQKEAVKNGLDSNMLANQFWQESRFNPKAVSPAGARGIVQMMPFHQGKYGLETTADFFDADKSIVAGAQMMGQLSRRYGDQRLALVAYNGGGKAIDFAEQKLGKEKVSFEEWHAFNTERRKQLGSDNRGAWHVETLDYTNKIALAADKPKPDQDPALLAQAANKKVKSIKDPAPEPT